MTNTLSLPIHVPSIAWTKKNLVASRRNLNPQPSIGRVFQVLLRGHQRLNGTDHRRQSPVAHPRLKWQFTGQTDFECGCGHHVFKLKSRTPTICSHRKPFVLAPQSGETIQPQSLFSQQKRPTFWLQHAPRKKTLLSIPWNKRFALNMINMFLFLGKWWKLKPNVFLQTANFRN